MPQRTGTALDRLLRGHARAPSGEAAAAIEDALAGVAFALAHLASVCREHAIDPTEVIPLLFAGGPGAVTPAVADSMSGDAPDAARCVQGSRALIEALDRGDARAVDGLLAPAFVYVDAGRVKDRAALLRSLAQRASTVPHVATRAWVEERVVGHAGTCVVVAKVQETQGGNATHGGYLYDGWYVLQWVRVEGAWAVQLLSWQTEITDRDWWNDTYRKGRGFSLAPNRLLVDTVAALPPGDALDLAMGQGRNALYLAARGWRVTGVDSSAEGLRVARDEAGRRGLAVELVHADLDHWPLGEDRYDLVTLIYASEHTAWLDRVVASLRPGGTLVIEGWAKERPESAIGFADGELARRCAELEIVRDEVVTDAVPDWACDTGTLVRFVARKP